MKQITVLFNGRKQKTLLLDVSEVFIGRGAKVHVPLDENPIVSRRHASIRSEMDYHVLKDLGGANGTFVNESRIMEVRLRVGDRITLGKHMLRYEEASSEARSLEGVVRVEGVENAAATLPSDSFEFADEADLQTPWAADKRESGPAPAWEFAGGVSTMAASRDELEVLLAQQKIKQGPHLSVNVDGSIELIALDEALYLIGHTSECRIRLKGKRWLGKVAASLKKRRGIWWIHARSPFWNPVRVGGSKLQKKRKLRTPSIIHAGDLKIRFSPGEQ